VSPQNPRSLANLRRGGIVGSAESAARARQGKAARASQVDALEQLAGEDPWGAYVELHRVMTRHMVKLLREEERAGSKPSRDVTDRLREYRQTTEALSAYRAPGALAEAREFFATLDDRLEGVLGRLGPSSPAVEPASEAS
jgi:hypothetical protein